MLSKLFYSVNLHRHVFVAAMAYFDLLYNVVEQFGLDILKAVGVLSFAVHASWHVPSFNFVILDETSVTHYFGAFPALFGVHWHGETDDAPEIINAIKGMLEMVIAMKNGTRKRREICPSAKLRKS